MNPIRELAFKLITELCFEACGDGDSAIVSEEYKILANDFENWVNEKYPGHFVKFINDDLNCITFSEHQECVWFVKDEATLPKWVDNRLVHPWL